MDSTWKPLVTALVLFLLYIIYMQGISPYLVSIRILTPGTASLIIFVMGFALAAALLSMYLDGWLVVLILLIAFIIGLQWFGMIDIVPRRLFPL